MDEHALGTLPNVDDRENVDATKSNTTEDQASSASTPSPPSSPALSSPMKEASNKEREPDSAYERGEFCKRMFSLTENERVLEGMFFCRCQLSH